MTTVFLPIHFAHSQSSKLFLKRPKSRLFVSSHGRHPTAREQSSSSPPLHYVPAEIAILGRSCDVVKHRNLLKIALSRSLLNVLTFQWLSQIIANLTSENLAEREAESTNLPWTQTEKNNEPATCRVGQRACRAKKPVSCLNAFTDEDCTPWKTKMNQEDGFVRIGGPFFKPASRARGMTSTKTSCGMFRKLLTISVGPLIVPNLTISLL